MTTPNDDLRVTFEQDQDGLWWACVFLGGEPVWGCGATRYAALYDVSRLAGHVILFVNDDTAVEDWSRLNSPDEP